MSPFGHSAGVKILVEPEATVATIKAIKEEVAAPAAEECRCRHHRCSSSSRCKYCRSRSQAIRDKEALLPLVFALGNPGKRFERTRHNVGFDTADTMAASFGFKLKRRCFRLYRSASLAFPSGSRSLVVQPLTYMNNSGAIVGHFIPKRFSVSDVVVVCDTLDLPVGAVRIRKGGSTAGHKTASLSDHFGKADSSASIWYRPPGSSRRWSSTYLTGRTTTGSSTGRCHCMGGPSRGCHLRGQGPAGGDACLQPP